MELVNDLITLIAIYATEVNTIFLLSLTTDLASLAYSTNVWRNKTLVENRGLVVDDVVVGGLWVNYYRLTNRTYYGHLTLTEFPYTTTTPIASQHAVVAGIMYKYRWSENLILTQYSDGTIAVYNILGHRVYEDKHKRPAIRVIYAFDGREVYWIDERGDVYRFKTTLFEIVPKFFGANAVAVGDLLTYLSRDGRWYSNPNKPLRMIDEDTPDHHIISVSIGTNPRMIISSTGTIYFMIISDVNRSNIIVEKYANYTVIGFAGGYAVTRNLMLRLDSREIQVLYVNPYDNTPIVRSDRLVEGPRGNVLPQLGRVQYISVFDNRIALLIV